MIVDERLLTPQPSQWADGYNYTWWNGKGDYPQRAGHVFLTKGEMAEQVYEDYKDSGLPEVAITGEPDYVGENTVIGGPGFGWYGTPPKRFPHIGGVHFNPGVEIGSNVTIDRGALGTTLIGWNVKIDNGVHIGHNASIGSESILTAHCVIGGSARIGRNVWIGLGAIIKNQIRVGEDAVIGMGAVVIRDVAAGVTVVGNPARPI